MQDHSAGPAKANPAAESEIRELIQACRLAGDHPQATKGLRRLRRLTELKPNEHRQLFRALARTGRRGLLVRYLNLLKRAEPDESNWNRRCLAFWSEGEMDWLFWCAQTHPAGLEQATTALSALAKVSDKFGEQPTATAIQSWVAGQARAGFQPDPAIVRPNLPSRPSIGGPSGARKAAASGPGRTATHETGPGDEILLDLRRSIEALGSRKDDAKRLTLLRRLRRLTPLRPGEHRQLFRILRSRQPELVARHGARLDRAAPSSEFWHKLLLQQWDEDSGRLEETLAYVRGQGVSPDLLLGLARASVKHGKWQSAERFLETATEMAAGDPGQLLDCAKGWIVADRPERATELLAGVAAGGEASVRDGLNDAIQAEIIQMIETLGADTWNDHAARIDRLEALAPDNPSLPRLRSAVEAWRTPRTARRGPGKAPVPSGRRSLAAGLTGDQRPSAGSAPDFGKWFSDQAPGSAHLRLLVEALPVVGPRRGRIDEVALFEQYLADAIGRAIEAGEGAGLDPLIIALEEALGKRLDLIEPAARTLRLMGLADHAAAYYVHLPPRRLDSATWLALGREAVSGPTVRDTGLLSRQIAGKFGSRGVERWARELAEDGRLAEVEAVVATVADPAAALSVRLAVIRGLYSSERYEAQLKHTLDLFDVGWPFTDVPDGAADLIVAAGRLLLRRGSVGHVWSNPPEAWLQAKSEAPTPLARWARAMVLAAALRRQDALTELERAAADQAECPVSGLDFRAEIGGLHLQYNDFAPARAAFEQASKRGRSDHFVTLEHMTRVAALCPDARHYPECLVDLIFEELGRDGPIGYDPERGHLMTVTGTLAHGGSERQTANIIAAMAAEPRVRRQSVLIRSVEGDNAFFLPTVSEVDAEIEVYGHNWRDRSPLEALVPALSQRPGLAGAIDLLPHGQREELLRVVERLLRLRPASVHIRQDLTIVGLACALAGVPTFLIHRGSLARNTWAHTPLQAEQTLRPMRHLYRRLLTETPCRLVNNSGPGLASDKDWLELSDPDRFHVVHNAVEFDKLGEATGPNLTLRAQLGIPETAPVVGGVFRMVAVKRPMLWIEIARRVLAELPDAHFIIAGGDAEFGDPVRRYAADHGFADRLHTPGAVQDVGEWYRAFDVLLLTSDREGLPNVNIEAQHFGVPVVTADVGGAAETIMDGVTGVLVHRDAGAEAFAEGVVAVLRKRGEGDTRSTEPSAFVQGAFSVQRAVERLVAHFGFG